jgi:hypothetical protein
MGVVKNPHNGDLSADFSLEIGFDIELILPDDFDRALSASWRVNAEFDATACSGTDGTTQGVICNSRLGHKEFEVHSKD